MRLKDFLSKKISNVLIGHIESDGIVYNDVKQHLPTNHIHVPLITPEGTYGLASLVKYIWESIGADAAEQLGGFAGKIIKSLYPQANIEVKPYPDIGGDIVYHTIAYLMEKVSEKTGNNIWILSEYPLNEENDITMFLNTIKDRTTNIPLYIITLSDQSKVQGETIQLSLPPKYIETPADKEELKLLIKIALLAMPSYGYILKKSLKRLLFQKREERIYKNLIKKGFLEPYGVFIRFTNRKLFNYLIQSASQEDIYSTLSILDRKTPGSIYARAYLYSRLGKVREALCNMKLYISTLKKQRYYRLAYTHMKPIIDMWRDHLQKIDIETFLYVATVSGNISTLEQQLARQLLSYDKPSTTALFMLSQVYEHLDEDIQALLKNKIEKRLKEPYSPVKNSLLAHAMLSILYIEKNLSVEKIQRYTLYIGTKQFKDPELSARSAIIRSRINTIFHKDTEALGDIQYGIQLTHKENIPWHLASLYNNLAILLSRNSTDTYLDMSLLFSKAYEISFAYFTDNVIVPFANYIYESASMGIPYKMVMNIWEVFKNILQDILTPKDMLSIMWALSHINTAYGYFDEVKKLINEMKQIVENHNLSPEYIRLYHAASLLYTMSGGDIENSYKHLKDWKAIIGDIYDEEYNYFETLYEAIFGNEDKVYTQSIRHIYYSAVRTGRYIEGINLLKDKKKQLLRQGKLADIAKLEMYLGSLYKMKGILPSYTTHLHNALAIYTYLEAAYARYISQLLNIPTSYIEFEGVKNLTTIHISQMLISELTTILASSPSVENLLKNILSYIKLPASNMWILYKGENTYFTEYSVFRGIGKLEEKYYKDLDTLWRTHKQYDISQYPSYIFIKKTGKEGKLIIYAENRYSENVFKEEHLSWIDKWSDIAIALIENINLGEKAIKDPLTGVYSRWYILKILGRELELTHREKNPLSVLFIDIDDFKKINDTLGHLKGDELLKNVAKAIQENIRFTDYVGRYGGEEFIVVLANTHEDEAEMVARRIKDAIINTPSIPSTISIGIYTYYPNSGKQITPHKMIKRADKAMYNAKRSGKNRIVHYKDIAKR